MTDVRFTGSGVAFGLRSPALDALRKALALAFAHWLTPQDRQGFRPHITVQNKVTPEIARALHRDLATDFKPWSFEATGLQLWHYRGGPWSPAASFAFSGS